jgi:hypothetical protein
MENVAKTFPKEMPEPARKLKGIEEIVAELEVQLAHAKKIPPAEDESERKDLEAAFNYHIVKLLQRAGNGKPQ